MPVSEKMEVIGKDGKVVPHVYCIGDANGKYMLAHAASAQVRCHVACHYWLCVMAMHEQDLQTCRLHVCVTTPMLPTVNAACASAVCVRVFLMH